MSVTRFVRRRFCLTTMAAALILATAFPAVAAESVAAARKRPVRQESTEAVATPKGSEAGPGTRIGDAGAETSIGQVVFQVLLGEIVLRRGDA